MSAERYYEISIVNLCGEFVCGRITRNFFGYWKERTQDELATFMTALAPDEREVDVPPAHSDGTTPANWHEFDNVEHVSNALTGNNIVRVIEVERDEANDGFRRKPGGYEEDFEISAVARGMPDSFLICRRGIEIDRYTDDPADPVIVGKALARGTDTLFRCKESGGFDIRKLSISYIDFDGDDIVESLSYDGVALETESGVSHYGSILFYLGNLHAWGEGDGAPESVPAKPPGRLRVLAGSFWPSLRATLKAIFSLFGFPVFLLAMIGAAKYLQLFDLIELQGLALRIIDTQKDVLDEIAEAAAAYGIVLPAIAADALVLYLSIGNTMARAERNDLISVENDDSNHWALFKEWLTRGRVDSLLLSLPGAARDGFVRLFWPVMMLYRLKTPFVIEGPGPSGETISSCVPRRELVDFARMITQARGTWKGQEVQDFRQIFLWHVLLVVGASALTAHAFRLMG